MKKQKYNPRCDAKALMAGGAEKLIRCYDNGGAPEGTFDRYTVVYTGRYRHLTGGASLYVGMSKYPFHPQGFGQHGQGKDRRAIDAIGSGYGGVPIGRKNHLGRRIRFADLPEDCQKLVVRDLVGLWGPREKEEIKKG